MRLRKADRESLRRAMPGDVITVEGAGRDEIFSLVRTGPAEWAVLRGTVEARQPDRVTERVTEVLRGDAATVTDGLGRLGAAFPLPEQESGATDFPSPRDIFWRRCLDRMPGELLDSPEYDRRVAFSLVRARTGWKVFCCEELEEDRLEFGDYLNAVYTDEEVEIRVLRWWLGRVIGGRNGIIAETDIRSVLHHLGIDPDSVTVLPPEEEEEDEHDAFWSSFEAAQELAALPPDIFKHAPRPLAVDVIHIEPPIEERVRRSRSAR